MADEFKQESWRVEYEGAGITKEAWALGFKRLHFTQNVRTLPSHATHIFQCKFLLDQQPMQETLMKEAAQLSYAKPIKFNLATLNGQHRSTQHEHVIVDWVLKRDAGGFLLVVKTMDRTILATIESKNRAHTGSTIDSMLRKILNEHKISDLTVEACKEITHYGSLLQRNLTDMQFIVNELLPRSMSSQDKGGYSLFTRDGKKYYFETLGHTKNVFKAKANSLIYVRELENSYGAGKIGGVNYTVHGFDPFTKRPYIESVGSDVSPSYGELGPRVESTRYDYVPLQTKDAVKAWVTQRQFSNRYEAYPMVAQFRGSIDLEIPMQIDFSQTKFRTTCTHKVPVVQIRHLLTVGRLVQTVVFLRDKALL